MYNTVIGLEIHAELKSNSKVFSTSKNEYSELPNTNVSVVDLGMPGILPVLNKKIVENSILLASSLNCEIANSILFDRKNYFYPDLPKGYQITQSHMPFGINGKFKIFVNEEEKEILIHDIHLEEDTASIDHYVNFSLLDYNRCGTPLIEIVTEPCMYSVDEALTFLEYLRRVFLYLDVSDARIDKGQIRCDVNVSLTKDINKLGTRVEVKNVNSFTGVKESILYEIKRQTELLESGNAVLQETRRYDEATKSTISMRSKVDAIDYKYFVEPNIPNIKLSNEYIFDIKKRLIPLQFDRIKKYVYELGLSFKDANSLTKDINISNYFDETLKLNCNPKASANYLNNIILSYLNKNEIDINNISVKPNMLVSLIKLIDDNTITSKQAKELLIKSLEENLNPIDLVSKLNVSQISDKDEILKLAIKIINENESMVLKYKEGRNVLDFFIGQVMKETKGRANPLIVSEIFKEQLNNININK